MKQFLDMVTLISPSFLQSWYTFGKVLFETGIQICHFQKCINFVEMMEKSIFSNVLFRNLNLVPAFMNDTLYCIIECLYYNNLALRNIKQVKFVVKVDMSRLSTTYGCWYFHDFYWAEFLSFLPSWYTFGQVISVSLFRTCLFQKCINFVEMMKKSIFSNVLFRNLILVPTFIDGMLYCIIECLYNLKEHKRLTPTVYHKVWLI